MKYHLKDLFKALCVALIMNRVRIVNAFHYPKYKYHGMSFSLHSARDIDLEKGLINARQNIDRGESPGAGLPTAYEQSDAAYADLILTSVVQKNLVLDSTDIDELSEAGMMDAESTSKRSGGIFKDLVDVFDALKGGAHITRQKNGRI